VPPIDSAAPVWTLERWDSQLLIFGESAASDADGRRAGQMLALAVRAVLTFQHRAVRGPGPWTISPKSRVSLRLTGSNAARRGILH
jgi:hypothetical protein